MFTKLSRQTFVLSLLLVGSINAYALPVIDEAAVAEKGSALRQQKKQKAATLDSNKLAILPKDEDGPVDPDQPEVVPIKCVKADSEPHGLGQRWCKGFKENLKANFKKIVGNVVANLYEGKVLAFNPDSKGGFCVEKSDVPGPICALDDIKDGNETNYKGQKCQLEASIAESRDGFCNYESSGDMKIKSCAFENSVVIGAKAQSYKFYMEQLFNEIEDGKIKLTNYGTDDDPKYPCASFARTILTLENHPQGLVATEQIVQSRFPASQTQDVCDNKAQGQSMAACYLKMARKQLDDQYIPLLSCELMHRSKASYYYVQTNNEPYNNLFLNVVKPCVAHAAGVFNQNHDTNQYFSEFYKCYKGQVDGTMGAHAYLEKWMRDRYPSSLHLNPEKLGEITEKCPWSAQ